MRSSLTDSGASRDDRGKVPAHLSTTAEGNASDPEATRHVREIRVWRRSSDATWAPGAMPQTAASGTTADIAECIGQV